MVTQVMSPYVLMQEMAKLRRANAPYNVDPYGLTAAMRGVGTDFDAMNNSVVGANKAQDSQAQTDARLSGGYYPAQVASQMSGFNKTTLDNQQHTDMVKAIEAGHAAASIAGLDSGTPEYEQFMNHYLSLHGNYQAALGTVKGANQARTELQNRAFAQSIVKKGVEAELVKRVALGIFNEAKTAGGEGSKLFDDKEAMKQALEAAKKQVADAGVNVALNHDGNVVATDNAGNNIPIEPQMTAVAMLAMGNDSAKKVFSYLSGENQTAITNEIKKMEEARKMAAPVAAAKPVAATKVPPDPLLTRLHDLEKLYWGSVQKGVDPASLTPLKQKIDQLETNIGGAGKPAANPVYGVDAGLATLGATGGIANPFLDQAPDDLYNATPDTSTEPGGVAL